MTEARAATRQVLVVYALVCAVVFATTRLGASSTFGPYVHLAVAAIFLLTALRMPRDDPRHFGLALGGLLEPSMNDRPRGPLGLFDLARALWGALPSALREVGAAFAVGAVVFPLYAVGFYMWNEPARAFDLTLPPDLVNIVLAQLIVVAEGADPGRSLRDPYLNIAPLDTSKFAVFRGPLLCPAHQNESAKTHSSPD